MKVAYHPFGIQAVRSQFNFRASVMAVQMPTWTVVVRQAVTVAKIDHLGYRMHRVFPDLTMSIKLVKNYHSEALAIINMLELHCFIRQRLA